MDLLDMEYDEYSALQDLTKLGLPFFRTGSREICKPAPMGTDVDFVVLETSLHSFASLGFQDTSSAGLNEYGESNFCTYRKGEVNLIVVDTYIEFRKWQVATAAAKQMNLIRKKDRINLFQGVLYGNWI
jgi:hypothetical protein